MYQVYRSTAGSLGHVAMQTPSFLNEMHFEFGH